MKNFSTPASRARDAAARAARPSPLLRLLPGSGARRGLTVGLAAGLTVGLTAGLLGGVALGRSDVGWGDVGRGDVGWGGSGRDAVGADRSGVFRQGRDDDEAAAPEATPRPAARITLAFAGDIHFENHLAVLAQDPDALSELRETLGAADLSVANIETAITERGAPIPGKPFTWRAPAGAIDAVAGAGVDVATMANNHAVDFGDVGLADTLAAIEAAPIPVIGIGEDEDTAFRAEIIEVKGVRVAILNASQVYEETLYNYSAGPSSAGIAYAAPRDRAERAVREAREEADVVVMYLHGGAEGYTCPGDEAIASVKAFERAGADIVVVDHAHRVNGAGWVGDAYAHFGLGNFVYYMSSEPAAHTGVLTLTVDVPATDGTEGADSPRPRPDRPLVTEADWDAMLIEGDGIPRRQDAATTARLQQTFEAARECTPARATP